MLSALAALALAASVPSPQQREPIALAPAAAVEPIAGRVVDAGGAPLGNVLVRRCVNLLDHLAPVEFGANVFDLGRAPSSDEVRTGTDGSFRLPGPSGTGAFVLEVELEDGGIFAESIEPDDRPRDGSPCEIAAPRRRVVAGRVVDAATGAGVPLATIALEHELFGPPPTSGDVLARGGALMLRVEGGYSVWEPPERLAAWLRDGHRLRRSAWRVSVRTRDDGSFSMPVLEWAMVHEVALSVSADGYGARFHAIDLGALASGGDAGTIAIARATPTRVRVLDADGRPVAGASVRASARETLGESFPVRLDAAHMTGADGAVEIALPSRGIRWIAARAPGGGDWTAVRSERGAAEVEIRFGKPASLRVRILDEQGRPLDGECALLAAGAIGPCEDLDAYLPFLAPAPIGPELARAVDGVARIDGVLQQQHLLVARAPRHAAIALPVDLDPTTGRTALDGVPAERSGEVEVRLRRFETRRVRVVEFPAERPVPGAVVDWRTRNQDDGTLATSGTLRTDAEGAALFSAPRGTAANLEVAHPAFAAVITTVAADAAETTVRLSLGGSLVVRVVRSGKPIPHPLDVRLIVRTATDEAERARDARIAAPEGACRFEGLAAGTYEIDLVPSDGMGYPSSWLGELERSRRRVAVAEGAETFVEIDLAEPAGAPLDAARLRGTVAARGTSVPLEAWLDGPMRSPDRDRERWLELDGQGAFDFGPLPAGEYFLNVRVDLGRGYADLAERTIVLAPAERATADLAIDLGGPVRGVVRDAATGEPIEGARVRLCAIGDAGAPDDAWRFADDVETAAEGGFSWPAAPVGACWLRILAEDRAPHYARVEVVPGRAADLGEIALARGVPVGGRVADAPEGAACLRFEFVPPLPADLPPRFFLTYDAAHAKLAEGTAAFETRELRPGRYTVRLEDEDGELLPYREIALDVGADGAKGLELRFEPR